MHLSVEQEQEIRDAFSLFDHDGDGVISVQEVSKAMRALGQQLSESEVQSLMKTADINQDGVIDDDEFVQLMCRYFGRVSGEEDEMETLREAFNVFDRDKSGFISALEIKQVFLDLGERLSDADVQSLILVADTNNDGHISFEEFCKIVKSSPKTNFSP